MTGLKSGSGDDLWGDDGDDENDSDDANGSSTGESSSGQRSDSTSENGPSGDASASPGTESETSKPTDGADSTETTDWAGAAETTDRTDAMDATAATETAETTDASPDDSTPTVDATATEGHSTGGSQSYIVRRAVQDKSVQFERDERLTFFVHDDVADGERDLITDLQSALGRDVPKFDVREAVYRAALQNPDDVLEELLKMGYSLDEE